MIAILTDYQLMILNTLRHKYDYCTVTKLCLSRCRSTWKVEHSSKTLLVVHSRGATGPNAGKSSTIRLMLLTGMMSYLDNVRMRMVVAGQKRAAHRGAWTCHGVSRVRRECAALAHLQLSASKIKGSDFVDTFCVQKHCGEFILPPGVENLNTIAAITRHRAGACSVHVHASPPRLELQPPNSYPTRCYSISSFNSHRFFFLTSFSTYGSNF